ncbi:MAG: hypothetical protein U0931_15025 [Vulcanimicrobiota bacterium]
MSKIEIQEDKELANLAAQIDKLLEPDRKLEAERNQRHAKVAELRARQAELQAVRERKERRQEVAAILRERVAARADLEAKKAAWLELMEKAHAIHKQCLEASIFESNFGAKVSQLAKLSELDPEAELQEVCAEYGIDYLTSCQNLQTFRSVMEQDMLVYFKPAFRPHVLDQFTGHRLSDDPSLKVLLDEARAQQATEEALAQEPTE